jgi:hypothetical protein
MAYRAILLSLVKTDFCSQNVTAFKFMALETLFIRHAPPGLVAEGAVLNRFMKETQGPRLSGRIIEKEPPGKGHHEKNTE